MKTIDKIITKVNTTNGAPRGRNNKGVKPTNEKVYDCKVPMVATKDYDKGGVYWGIGSELRVQYTKDLTYIFFYRKQN